VEPPPLASLAYLAMFPIVAIALTLVTSRDLYTASKINNTQQILLMLSIATLWFGTTNAAREIVKEAPIYKRERTVNLGILPYMFSKIMVLGILCLFQSAVLTLVVQLGEPLHQGIFLPPLLETYITLALTSLAGLMVGLTISAIAPNNDRAISFVPIILLPQVIFSGAIIALKDWVTQVLAVISGTLNPGDPVISGVDPVDVAAADLAVGTVALIVTVDAVGRVGEPQRPVGVLHDVVRAVAALSLVGIGQHGARSVRLGPHRGLAVASSNNITSSRA